MVYQKSWQSTLWENQWCRRKMQIFGKKCICHMARYVLRLGLVDEVWMLGRLLDNSRVVTFVEVLDIVSWLVINMHFLKKSIFPLSIMPCWWLQISVHKCICVIWFNFTRGQHDAHITEISCWNHCRILRWFSMIQWSPGILLFDCFSLNASLIEIWM